MDIVIVLAKIKPGEADALRGLLEQISRDRNGNPYIRFSEDRLTHFARWLIVDDPDAGPRLLFASVYDGGLRRYVQELIRISPGLDAIWGKCDGYGGKASFLQFVRQHAQQPFAPFYAFRHETVESIRSKIAIRQQLEQFLDLGDVARYIDDPGVKPFLDQLSRVATAPSLWQRLSAWLDEFLLDSFESIRRAVVSVIVQGASWFGRLGENEGFSRVTDTCDKPAERRAEFEHIRQLEDLENIFEQNQFTVLAEIKPGRLRRLQLVLFLTAYVNKYGYPRGEITGLHTIHTLHWIVIDGGRRVIGLSNYDGSMENYVGDFIDKFGTGLDAYFSNCVGYPEGGIMEVPEFVAWVRENQLVCQLYYSAYPQETILTILRDCQIGETIGTNFDREAVEQWLNAL